MRYRGWLLLMAVTVCATGCGQRPRVDILAAAEDGRVLFDVPRSDVNGLLGFMVEDEDGAVLWHVKLSYETGRWITYGVLPMGSNQVVPADGSAPPDIRGRRVRVRVEY